VELAKVNSAHEAAFAGALAIDMDDVEERDKKDDNLNIVWAKDILTKADDFDWEYFVDLPDLAKLTRDSHFQMTLSRHVIFTTTISLTPTSLGLDMCY